MSEVKMSDVQTIATRNAIAVDGMVNATIEDWNALLAYIDRLQKENAELRDFLKMVADADSASNEAKAYMVHTFIYNAKKLINNVKKGDQ